MAARYETMIVKRVLALFLRVKQGYLNIRLLSILSDKNKSRERQVREFDFEPKGRKFESCRVYHFYWRW